MTNVAQALASAFQHFQAGRLPQAEAQCRQILAIDPRQPDALFFLGLIAHQRGKPDAAIEFIGKAIARNAKSPLYHNVLGLAQRAAGKPGEAIKSYRRALALDPKNVDAHVNLGNALQAKRDLAGAVESFRRAIAIEPGLAEAHFNLGGALLAQNDLAAIDAYRRAIALKPDYAEAYNNLGLVLRKQGQPSEAEAAFRRALALKSGFAEALVNLGNVLAERGNIREAITCLRQALALDPGNAAAHSDLIFNLNFDPKIGPEEQQAERRRWWEAHGKRYAPAATPRLRDPDPERRLRVGYVSANFRSYAATYACGGVLTHHDKTRFEIFCYSDTTLEDELTVRLRQGADHWRETTGMSDEAMAEQIRQDKIDILVDLTGHMVGQRLLVFARKPAPIQMTGWGEPTGTGLATMDYLLGDTVLVPESERRLLAERVIDLPGVLGYWMPETLPEPGTLPALTNGFITFGSFNRRSKLSDGALRSWSRILRAVPNSRLLLKTKGFEDPAQQSGIRAVLAEGGIAPDRVRFLGQGARQAHFEAYREIDLALDPFPHGGGMTALDAVAMGVPVVSLAGQTICSRVAAGCLTALDLAEFIAFDEKAYDHIAVAAVKNLDSLMRLRGELRQRLMSSAIGDSRRYAGAVDAAYRDAWRRACVDATA